MGAVTFGRTQNAKKQTHCDAQPDLGNQPIDLGSEVDKLKYECIREIADAQDVGATTYQSDVPAAKGSACQTVPVSTAAYRNTATIKWGDFGETSGKKHGFVLAKITNRGSCNVGGNIDIPPYTTVYWIVEFKGGANGPSARIIYADDSNGSAVKDLDDKNRFRFGNCGNDNESTNDMALFKYDFPCDGIHFALTKSQALHESPPRSPLGVFRFDSLGRKSVRDGDPIPGLWMPCGGDCCFTDGGK
jgi:hypothetical protein